MHAYGQLPWKVAWLWLLRLWLFLVTQELLLEQRGGDRGEHTSSDHLQVHLGAHVALRATRVVQLDTKDVVPAPVGVQRGKHAENY